LPSPEPTERELQNRNCHHRAIPPSTATPQYHHPSASTFHPVKSFSQATALITLRARTPTYLHVPFDALSTKRFSAHISTCQKSYRNKHPNALNNYHYSAHTLLAATLCSRHYSPSRKHTSRTHIHNDDGEAGRSQRQLVSPPPADFATQYPWRA
jgi:hypothetical protein